ncbi:Ionotropic receptor 238 [Blattella germanica]|nr:Ionotropic receptor 238 [Blattella germanica]
MQSEMLTVLVFKVTSIATIFASSQLNLEIIRDVLETKQRTEVFSECIKTIGLEHFTLRRSLMISTTSELEIDRLGSGERNLAGDLQTKLLQEFHHLQILPTVLSKPPQSLLEEEWNLKNVDTYNNYEYILILRHQQFAQREIINFLREQIEHVSNYKTWNNRGKFIVAITNTVLHEEATKIVEAVLQELWSFWIYNVIVMFYTADDISLGSVKIYTWFPYHMPSGNCGVLYEVVHLDTCMRSEENTTFLKNESLYPNKIPLILNGCPMRIATVTFEPYILTEGDDLTGGADPELIWTITQHLNMSLQVKIRRSNGTWPGLDNEVQEGHAEVVFAALLLFNLDYALRLELTTLYHTEHFTWVIARAEMYPRWLAISRVFTPSNWAIQLFSIAFVSVFINVLYRIRYSKSGGELWSVSKSMLSMWAVYLGDGSPKEPKDILVRIFFLSWVLQAFAINTVYQAFFNTYEIDPGRRHQIATFHEVREADLIYAFNKPLNPFFRKEVLETFVPRFECEIFDCLVYAAKNKKGAMFAGREFFIYHINEVLREDQTHELYVVPDDYGEVHFVMYVKRGYPLLPRINDVMTRAFQAGLYNHWIDLILEPRRIAARLISLQVLDEFTELNLSHLQGAYIFYFLGISICIIAFVGELFIYVLKMCISKCAAH